MIKVLCNGCQYREECDFYSECIQPCEEVVKLNDQIKNDEPFIKCLRRNLEDYECDFYKGVKEEE